ncbi:MAG: potassium channel family protein, partial [Myxococcales bacterium]
MKIVLAGGGRVGALLAARLMQERHAVTVVERDRAACERLFEELGVLTVAGDATDPRALQDAGLRGADIAIGVLARDADNLAFASLARAMSDARIMVRMLDDAYRDAYRLAGVRELVAEADLVVGRMATAIEFPQIQGSLPLPGGDAIVFELSIGPRALVNSKTVAQVRADERFPRDCVFIGFADAQGGIELPTGTSVLRAGQVAIVVARRAQLAAAVAFL